ncbi:MAG: cupin domain-containing protein [Actinomycetota bacterium]|nr:cupin domain-containing protein [Actinomycetota bacterium]
MKTRYFALLVTTAAAMVAVPAAATPGSGASGTIVARGTAVEKIKSRSQRPFDVVVQKITIAPGGHTGWHTHPGNAIAVVKSGTLTIYDSDDPSCTGRTFTTGQVYLDPGGGHVHLGRNESATTPLEIVVTYLDVPLGGGVRADGENPGTCPF